MGYRIVDGYIEKNTIRTDAPSHIVFDILKYWKKFERGEENYLKHVEKDSATFKSLTKHITIKPDFTLKIEKK